MTTTASGWEVGNKTCTIKQCNQWTGFEVDNCKLLIKLLLVLHI